MIITYNYYIYMYIYCGAGSVPLSNLWTQFLPEQEELEWLGYAQVTERAIPIKSALPPSFIDFYVLQYTVHMCIYYIYS